jgi:hypothetical protein
MAKSKQGQKDKQWSAKHYTENKRSINITDESYFSHNGTFLIQIQKQPLKWQIHVQIKYGNISITI